MYVHMGAAPPTSDGGECSWLYAGKPGCIHSVLVVRLCHTRSIGLWHGWQVTIRW